MNSYTSGTAIVFTSTTANAQGTLIDPTLVFKVQTPDGVVTDYSSTIVRVSLGVDTATFTGTQAGLHRYEWIATGAAVVSAVGEFMVNPVTF